MAHQMILEDRRRKRDAADRASTLGEKNLGVDALLNVLRSQRHKLGSAFDMWDTDSSGSLDKQELRSALFMLGIKPTQSDLNAFFGLFDEEKQKTGISLRDLGSVLKASGEGGKARKPKSLSMKFLHGIYDLINTMAVQTILYLAIVAIFQLLTDTLRMKEEFYLDKMIADTLIENPFSEHVTDTYLTIRRQTDIWTWGNLVLWPGLLGNNEPACGEVGVAGIFQSALADVPPINLTARPFKGGCNDHVWPDGGDGMDSHSDGATALSVREVVARMNQFDWTDGIMLQQVRVAGIPQSECDTEAYGGTCLPEMAAKHPARQDTAPFGYNWTHPGSPLSNPFRHYVAEDLGTDPSGVVSAHRASFQQISPGGFASFVIPFFTEAWIPEERGKSSEITDFRRYKLDKNGNFPMRKANYFCARISWNGEHIHQLCDPNVDSIPGGVTTGVVRAAIEEFWNDLKRAHYLDTQSRALMIVIPFHANNIGAASRISLIMETTSTGVVLSSFVAQTRVTRADLLGTMRTLVWIAFGFTLFFVMMEGIEVYQSGIAEYVGNMWNLMDWCNFIVFFMVFSTLLTLLEQESNRKCSAICQSVGYRDDWEVMATTQKGKTLLSICVCVQLLKIIKFTSALVPKMDLAPSVLAKALPDLIFFGVVFMISMLAFSSMFFIQLGPVMQEYNDNFAAFVALYRALFGDFNIDDIFDNSAGYLNALLFLIYLFVAVFIMLSMFFAILGESQANVRDDQREAKRKGMAGPEYGAITYAYRAGVSAVRHLPMIGSRETSGDGEEDEFSPVDAGPTAVERIEARLFDMGSKLKELDQKVIDSFEALTKRLGDLTDAPAGTLHSSASSPSRRLRQPSAELAKGWRSGLGSGSRGGIPGGVDPKRDRRPRSGGVRCQNGHHHDGSRHVAAHAITAHDGLQGDGGISLVTRPSIDGKGSSAKLLEQMVGGAGDQVDAFADGLAHGSREHLHA